MELKGTAATAKAKPPLNSPLQVAVGPLAIAEAFLAGAV